MAVSLKFLKIPIRGEYLCPGLPNFCTPDSHQTLGILIGKVSQKDGIYNAENGGVGADAEGKSENRNGGEAGFVGQHAQAEAQILPQCLDKRFPAGRADDFLRNLEIPT